MAKSRSKRVIVEIKGGVGNQMFQYAAARALSLDLGAELVIEKRLGFLLDRQYKREFQLDHFPISYAASTFRESLPFFVDRLRSFYARAISHKALKNNSRNYLFDRDFHFESFTKLNPAKRRYWLAGYYQDSRYFELQRETILKELTPPTPTDRKFIELANLAGERDLIALGIRMYEESSSPEAHARDRIVKTIPDYELALAKLLKQVSNPLILVFTSGEFEFLKSLELPVEYIFINPESGFADTIDTLWLMSHCRHHIFNNSTFYWWGAVLSQMNYDSSEQKIVCSDNFLNPEIGYPNWEKF